MKVPPLRSDVAVLADLCERTESVREASTAAQFAFGALIEAIVGRLEILASDEGYTGSPPTLSDLLSDHG